MKVNNILSRLIVPVFLVLSVATANAVEQDKADIATPKWSYTIFNSSLEGCDCRYKLIKGPIFDQSKNNWGQNNWGQSKLKFV